jgi:hypothetical protein
MNRQIGPVIGKLAIIGVIAGTVLAALLGIIQELTNKKVYELLVNVDYIPVVKHWQVGPVMGFLFHMIVSICIVFALYFILANWQLQRKVAIYLLANTFGGALLFSLTALSESTPAFTDPAAFSFWVAGHAVYGLTVGGMIQAMFRKEQG